MTWHGWREAVTLRVGRASRGAASLEPPTIGMGQSWYEPRYALDEAEVERARRTSSWRSTRLRLVERGETPQTERGAAPCQPVADRVKRTRARTP